MATKAQTEAAIQTIRAIADAIKELKEVPSGHLYAQLMGRMSLDQYNQIIGILVNAGVVKQDPSYLLHWIG